MFEIDFDEDEVKKYESLQDGIENAECDCIAGGGVPVVEAAEMGVDGGTTAPVMEVLDGANEVEEHDEEGNVPSVVSPSYFRHIVVHLVPDKTCCCAVVVVEDDAVVGDDIPMHHLNLN